MSEDTSPDAYEATHAVIEGKVKRNLSASTKAAAKVGAATFVGALLLGPAGMAAGAAMGTGVAYAQYDKKAQGVLNELRKMDPGSDEFRLFCRLLATQLQVKLTDLAVVLQANWSAEIVRQVIAAMDIVAKTA